MKENARRNEQARQRESIGHPLDKGTGRAKRRRGHVRPAVVVHDHGDDEVDAGRGRLRAQQRAGVLLRVAHLGNNGKVSRGAGAREYKGRHGRDALGKGGVVVEELVVGHPGAGRSVGRAILYADADGDGQDWGVLACIRV